MIFSDRFIIHHQRLLHALRVVMACAIAFFISGYFKIPHSYWSLITIFVVMGPISYVGAVITRANQRLIGTFIGSSLGLTLFYIPEVIDTEIVHNLFILLFLAFIMMRVVGRHSYTAIMAGVTLIIVATAGIGNEDIALWRAVNVIWGSLLSMVCIRLFFPSNAFIQYQLLIAEFLQIIADYYLIHNNKLLANEKPIYYRFDKLIENLAQQKSLIGHLTKEQKCLGEAALEILNKERRIMYLFEVLTGRNWHEHKIFEKIQDYSDLSTIHIQLFEQINQLSIEVDKGHLKPITEKEIKFLHVYDHIANNTESYDPIYNENLFVYFWLNNEMANIVFKLSIDLCKMFNHKPLQ
ncbi:MAG: FUSC family protein [Psychromonas sp.]|nr:FUSC family protein [Psychromonas sp.]